MLSTLIPQFYYLMKLHYSQTPIIRIKYTSSFTTLWNYTTLKLLRVSWIDIPCFTTLWNYTTLKPFCWIISKNDSFTTLWNYTTLKRTTSRANSRSVLLPYEITLLSNCNKLSACASHVLLPYEITLLSNGLSVHGNGERVLLPYEITLLSNWKSCISGVSTVLLPYEITLLSNRVHVASPFGLFYYLMKLHYSQT